MTELKLGRLLRSATTGYVFGCKIPESETPRFGDFVKAPAQRGLSQVIGLIYDIAVSDDGFVRPMSTADLPDEVILDQRNNRNVPIEVSVLAIGSQTSSGFAPGLPPQPPITLDTITACTEAEVCAFTERLDFLPLIIDSMEAPADELLAALFRRAALCRPPQDRERFLQKAGRELAKLLSRDLPRLERLLRRIQPGF